MALINVTGTATTLVTGSHIGTRSWIIIQNNDSTNPVWIGFGQTPTTTDGMKLAAGTTFVVNAGNIGMLVQEIKAISGGSTVQVHVQSDGAIS